MDRWAEGKWSVRIFLLALPMAAILFTLFAGRYEISFSNMLILLNPWSQGKEALPSELWTIVFQLRLPRALAGAMIGASLAVSGAAYQGVFRNPLVNSGILGVASGASFGLLWRSSFLEEAS